MVGRETLRTSRVESMAKWSGSLLADLILSVVVIVGTVRVNLVASVLGLDQIVLILLQILLTVQLQTSLGTSNGASRGEQ